MQIRKASLNDINPLADLFDQYRIFYEQESAMKSAVSFLTQRLENEESIIFVATEKEILMGFVQLYPIFSSTQMKRSWLLNDLYVNAAHRGKGISVKLIDKAKELAKNTNAAGLMLETAKSNDIGNKLYSRTGFELDAGHNYYSWEVSL
ncbi:MAG: ribosomal protein S18 acetylase RimI-like enzyme [Paraglaciecola sp.]|jgi:ribosomal protein S18 acetylase RimI-like enzyme